MIKKAGKLEAQRHNGPQLLQIEFKMAHADRSPRSFLFSILFFILFFPSFYTSIESKEYHNKKRTEKKNIHIKKMK